MSKQNFNTRIERWVDSVEFFKAYQKAMQDISDPDKKAKAMSEAANWVYGRIKAQDPDRTKDPRPVTINYYEADKPKDWDSIVEQIQNEKTNISDKAGSDDSDKSD